MDWGDRERQASGQAPPIASTKRNGQLPPLSSEDRKHERAAKVVSAYSGVAVATARHAPAIAIPDGRSPLDKLRLAVFKLRWLRMWADAAKVEWKDEAAEPTVLPSPSGLSKQPSSKSGALPPPPRVTPRRVQPQRMGSDTAYMMDHPKQQEISKTAIGVLMEGGVPILLNNHSPKGHKVRHSQKNMRRPMLAAR